MTPGFRIFLALSLTVVLITCWKCWERKPQLSSLAEVAPEISAGPSPVEASARVPATPVSGTPAQPDQTIAPMEQTWGIKVYNVTLAMNGSLVNVGYEVVSPEKALSLADGSAAIYLIDQATGAKIEMPVRRKDVPLQGAGAHSAARMMRQQGKFPPSPGHLGAGQHNSIVFPNTNGTVKRGSKMTIVIGDSQTECVVN